MQFIFDQFSIEKDYWDDLNLGWAKLLDIDTDVILNRVLPHLPDLSEFIDVLKNNQMFNLLETSNFYYFLEFHNECNTADKLTRLWPSAKVILFDKNYTNFLNWRNHVDPRLADWTVPLLHKPSISWESDWFLDKSLFLEKIENLYAVLELKNFNQTYINAYYDRWMQTLEKLKEQ